MDSIKKYNKHTFNVERNIYDGDLEGFYLYYQMKDGSELGDWMLYGYYDTIFATNFQQKIERFIGLGPLVSIYTETKR